MIYLLNLGKQKLREQTWDGKTQRGVFGTLWHWIKLLGEINFFFSDYAVTQMSKISKLILLSRDRFQRYSVRYILKFIFNLHRTRHAKISVNIAVVDLNRWFPLGNSRIKWIKFNCILINLSRLDLNFNSDS